MIFAVESNQGMQTGMTLLEVLVGITVFAVGILALTQLQGGLARSAAESNTRTVAINIAEEAIETNRGFSRITQDPDGLEYAYLDIETRQYTVTRGGITYSVDLQVTDYWYDRAAESFTTTEPLVAAVSDFKLMRINVGWGDGPEFMIDKSKSTQGRLGSDGVVMSEVISSITSAADAKSATGGTGGLYLPTIDYNPGSNPEIISISLGDNKFKESTTPLPRVIRDDELVETTFDVVTYSQDDQGATFLRREEFRAVSCNCQLRVPNSGEAGGLRPTIWDGNDYTRGEFVSKVHGVGTSNQQSQLCDLCCRDHHDGGTGEEDDPADPGRSKYDPFRPADEYHSSGALSGDHKHYYRNSSGGLTLAESNGSNYMEACRMVRKDGFWQVAQDLRQEGLNLFPEDYLNTSAEVSVYSDYVTDALGLYESAMDGVDAYELNPPQLTAPEDMTPVVQFPATESDDPTILPTPLGNTSQQLRGRGIYVDYMSDTLRTIVDCLQDGGTGVECGAPYITTPLEIIPFYDVQLTWLARWNETPFNNPVDVSNEAIADNNTHSRGVAQRTQGTGDSTIDAKVHSGNLGLTGTDPIDPQYVADLNSQILYVSAQSSTPPPGVNQIEVEGTITSNINGFKASDVEISATGAQCNRTNTGFACLLESGVNNPRITVTNYYKHNQTRVACSPTLSVQGSDTGANGWTRFNLPMSSTTDADIIIKLNSC
ncbi:type IV pilus modification PilV family protein [Elongatibacter sediminis]|uniref:Type IV pilus modification protein PilV n=1 Tax=Elongatibacter sediminis TaxID=3119006 RepID=A0AAW9RLT8_9GAMM